MGQGRYLVGGIIDAVEYTVEYIELSDELLSPLCRGFIVLAIPLYSFLGGVVSSVHHVAFKFCRASGSAPAPSAR